MTALFRPPPIEAGHIQPRPYQQEALDAKVKRALCGSLNENGNSEVGSQTDCPFEKAEGGSENQRGNAPAPAASSSDFILPPSDFRLFRYASLCDGIGKVHDIMQITPAKPEKD